jgi:hypothetical protein
MFHLYAELAGSTEPVFAGLTATNLIRLRRLSTVALEARVAPVAALIKQTIKEARQNALGSSVR